MGRNDGGFTLVEAVVGWTVFLIALTASFKGFAVADRLLMKGREQKEMTMEAVNAARRGEYSGQSGNWNLEFEMGDETGSIGVVAVEYGTGVKLKGMEPVESDAED